MVEYESVYYAGDRHRGLRQHRADGRAQPRRLPLHGAVGPRAVISTPLSCTPARFVYMCRDLESTSADCAEVVPGLDNIISVRLRRAQCLYCDPEELQVGRDGEHRRSRAAPRRSASPRSVLKI